MYSDHCSYRWIKPSKYYNEIQNTIMITSLHLKLQIILNNLSLNCQKQLFLSHYLEISDRNLHFWHKAGSLLYINTLKKISVILPRQRYLYLKPACKLCYQNVFIAYELKANTLKMWIDVWSVFNVSIHWNYYLHTMDKKTVTHLWSNLAHRSTPDIFGVQYRICPIKRALRGGNDRVCVY